MEAMFYYYIEGIREDFKYYFADFVRKGGGGVPPKSVTPLSLKVFPVKGCTPKSVTFFY